MFIISQGIVICEYIDKNLHSQSVYNISPAKHGQAVAISRAIGMSEKLLFSQQLLTGRPLIRPPYGFIGGVLWNCSKT